MERRYRVLNIILTVVLFAVFISLAIFVYKDSYLRIGEAFVDLWNSLKFFANEVLFLESETEPTVLKYSEILEWQSIFPRKSCYFQLKAKAFLRLSVVKENISSYMSVTGA